MSVLGSGTQGEYNKGISYRSSEASRGSDFLWGRVMVVHGTIAIINFLHTTSMLDMWMGGDAPASFLVYIMVCTRVYILRSG